MIIDNVIQITYVRIKIIMILCFNAYSWLELACSAKDNVMKNGSHNHIQWNLLT